MIAASGRQQKASIHASYTLSEYLCRPRKANVSVIKIADILETRLTFQLEGEVVCQMAAFVIAT